MKYDPEILQNINNWLQTKGNNIIYVNGGNDPWSNGAGIKLKGETNSKVFMNPGCTHATRIKDLPTAEKKEAKSLLSDWVGIIIK